MARKSGVSYYTSRRCYYTWFRGEQHKLHGPCDDDRPAGPNYRAALDAWNALTEPLSFDSHADDRTVSYSIERYLNHMELSRSNSLRIYRTILGRVADAFRDTTLDQLNGGLFLNWLLRQKTWGAATMHSCYSKLKTALKHNSKTHGTPNPLADWKPPTWICTKPRGKEFALPADVVELLLTKGSLAMRTILRAIATTGARPGEILNAQWFNYNPTAKCITYEPNPSRGYKWKNAARIKGRDAHRHIFLPDDLAEIALANAMRRGPLFPAPRGGILTTRPLARHFRTLRTDHDVSQLLEQHGLPAFVVIPYALRHTYATNAIRRDVSIKKLADLMGTSVEMIEIHYCHAMADLAAMRRTFLDTQ